MDIKVGDILEFEHWRIPLVRVVDLREEGGKYRDWETAEIGRAHV